MVRQESKISGYDSLDRHSHVAIDNALLLVSGCRGPSVRLGVGERQHKGHHTNEQPIRGARSVLTRRQNLGYPHCRLTEPKVSAEAAMAGGESRLRQELLSFAIYRLSVESMNPCTRVPSIVDDTMRWKVKFDVPEEATSEVAVSPKMRRPRFPASHRRCNDQIPKR